MSTSQPGSFSRPRLSDSLLGRSSIADRFACSGPNPPIGGCGQMRTLELGCFFDGTGNNRWNLDSETSETNVVRLHDCYVVGPRANPPAERHRLYLIGVGAGRGQAGQPTVGTGPRLDGATGFGGKYRVNMMYNWVKTKIEEHCRTFDPRSPKLIDVFGFSRGSLSARTFVNLVNQALKTEPGPAFQNIQVRFLGVFDTVESIAWGYVSSEAPNCYLTNADYLAARHFTARHEIRYRFPLTVLDPGGQQQEYPGVHSDVGGGYQDTFQGKHNWLSYVTLVDMRRACGSRAVGIQMRYPTIPAGCDVSSQSVLRTGSDAELRRLYVHTSHTGPWTVMVAAEGNVRERIRRSRLRLSARPPGYSWR